MLLAGVALCVLSGCAETQLASHVLKSATNGIPKTVKVGKPYNIGGEWYTPEYAEEFEEKGKASWYGPGFHGKKTASGERYDQRALTAAHKTLPLPSLVRVTNLDNGRVAVVRVNDRGPFKHGRVIDLSERSAEVLGVKGAGIAQVKVEYLDTETRTLWADLGVPPQDVARATRVAKAAPTPRVNQQDMPVLAKLEQPEKPSVARGGSGNDALAVPSLFSKESDDKYDFKHTLPIGDAVASRDVAPLVEQAAYQVPKDELEKQDWRSTAATPAVAPPVKTYNTSGIESKDLGATPFQIKPKEIQETPPAVAKAETAPTPMKADEPATHQETASLPAAQSIAGVDGMFMIQAGSFSSQANADRLAAKIGSQASVTPFTRADLTLYKVSVGPVEGRGKADALLETVRANGVPDARVVRQ
jgi:rare lipoprotein A